VPAVNVVSWDRAGRACYIAEGGAPAPAPAPAPVPETENTLKLFSRGHEKGSPEEKKKERKEEEKKRAREIMRGRGTLTRHGLLYPLQCLLLGIGIVSLREISGSGAVWGIGGSHHLPLVRRHRRCLLLGVGRHPRLPLQRSRRLVWVWDIPARRHLWLRRRRQRQRRRRRRWGERGGGKCHSISPCRYSNNLVCLQ